MANNNNMDTNGTKYATYNAGTPSNVLHYWTGGGGGSGSGADGGNGGDVQKSDIYSIGASAFYNASIGIGGAATISHTQEPQQQQEQFLFNYDGLNESDYDTLYQQMNSNQCHSVDVNTNATYWNLTCDSPLEYAMPLYGYCMPFLLVITVVSNSLIVLVLSKKNMTTPTNFVLMGMAICDMLTVIFPAPGFWYMYTFGNHSKPLHPVTMCFVYYIFNEVVPAICHTISIWLTLTLAVQRYIYVCHAPMAHTWCTMPLVKRCTIYITCIAILHQLTRFFDRVYYPLTIEWNGITTEVCHMETAAWVHDYIGEDIYFTCFYLFRVLFVHLLPCIILVWLNILLFGAMRQAQERRKLLFRENRKRECKKLRESNCTTLMLIAVVTVFLIAEIPIAVVTAMHIVSVLWINFLNYSIANILIMFMNFFLVVSYPINFGIYCGMSRQFRETFKEIFWGQIIAKKDSSTKYSMVNGPRTCTNTNETVL